MRKIIPLLVAAAACGNNNNNNTPDAPGDGGSGSGLNPVGSFDPGFTPTNPNTPLSVEVTISGETLGENGLPFTPVNDGDPQFVDGWNVTFDKYIVVIGNVRLSPGATQFTDQSQLNPVVATKAGPYVIDVHKLVTSGANGFVGADGEEPAAGIFKWDAQDDGTAFDSGTLYAFSYDTVPAAYPATQVDLTDDEFPIYDTMVRNHWDKYIEATATYVGTYTDAAAAGSALGSAAIAEFAALPTTVHFTFGWNDATSSLDCVNPNNGDGDGDNLANRGVQPNTNGATIAQVTIHTDHVFWDKLKEEGTPLRMDYIAAWAGSDGSVDLDALGDKPLATTFADGTPLPDRAPYLDNPVGAFTTDQTDPSQVTLDLDGVPAANISGLSAFMAFSAQSQQHLNADGLCYVVGQNASDPYYHPTITPAQ